MINLRLENENDYFEVENLVRNSFWNKYRPGAFEHYIVHNLRKQECFIDNLAYVIECNNEIVGHINYSIGFIDYGDENVNAVVLGPVSIHENCQNRGLGTKIIEYTLRIAQNDKIPFIFVIGDENYYRRFNFESASNYNLYLEGTNSNEECPFFMIKIFDKSELKSKRGIFHNPDVFHVDQSDVDEFDRKFEYKEKMTLDSQLKEI